MKVSNAIQYYSRVILDIKRLRLDGLHQFVVDYFFTEIIKPYDAYDFVVMILCS